MSNNSEDAFSTDEDSDEEDTIPSLEEIMESGGRKPKTIKSEEHYVKWFMNFLKSKDQVLSD